MGSGEKGSSLLLLAYALLAVSLAVNIYLAVNNTVVEQVAGPLIKLNDTTYVVEGNIICMPRCPERRRAGINFYMPRGTMQWGTSFFASVYDNDTVVVTSKGRIIMYLTNGSAVVGNVLPQTVLPGRVYVSGNAPESQTPNDFAITLSDYTFVGPDGLATHIQHIAEASSTARRGCRLKNDAATVSVFSSPFPQIIYGYPSIARVMSSRTASFLSDATSETLGAYRCVQGNFIEDSAQLSITVNQAGSTCFNTVQDLHTEIVLLLNQAWTCVDTADVSDILSDEAGSASAYPYVCFSPAACQSAETVAGLQFAADRTTTGPAVTIPLGCTSRYNVRCSRPTI